jgi:hypothetical protein
VSRSPPVNTIPSAGRRTGVWPGLLALGAVAVVAALGGYQASGLLGDHSPSRQAAPARRHPASSSVEEPARPAPVSPALTRSGLTAAKVNVPVELDSKTRLELDGAPQARQRFAEIQSWARLQTVMCKYREQYPAGQGGRINFGLVLEPIPGGQKVSRVDLTASGPEPITRLERCLREDLDRLPAWVIPGDGSEGPGPLSFDIILQ